MISTLGVIAIAALSFFLGMFCGALLAVAVVYGAYMDAMKQAGLL